MRNYGREDVEKILKALGCDFVHGSDDGSGFIWNVPNPGTNREEAFDYDVPARTLIRELADAGLVDLNDIDDPEDFLDRLL